MLPEIFKLIEVRRRLKVNVDDVQLFQLSQLINRAEVSNRIVGQLEPAQCPELCKRGNVCYLIVVYVYLSDC